MNGTSGFQEVRSSPPDHLRIGSRTSNGIDSEQVPGTFFGSILLAVCAWALLNIPGIAIAQTEPITPSGLNTQVSDPIAVGGQTQYDITGGTRPGGGANLFHSFGEFGVPTNNIANFLNETALPTSNILGRVTGGNISNIFGTIQTTGFGNANLFLMNPTGFLFGPNATVNVGGMVAFTSADYIRLTDGGRFNANPNAIPGDLLTTAPVAAFGFLGPNFGAITIETTQLAVKEGQGITVVGGDITIDGGFSSGGLAAPNGRIEIASVASPGEVVRTPQGLNVDAFAQLGTVSLTNNAALDVSDSNGTGVGTIRIRGGRFLMDQSHIGADTSGDVDGSPVGIDIGVRNDVVLQNFSVISSTTQGGQARASDIRITASSVLVDNLSAISSSSSDGPGRAGNITLTVDQLTVTGGGGIQAGAFGPGQAGSITINGTESVTVSGNFGGDPTLPSLITSQSQSPTQDAGSISITTPSLAIMDGARVEANSFAAGRGGDVVLDVHNLTLSGGAQIKTSSQPFFVSPEVPAGAGDIHVNATETISLSGAGTGLFSETSGAGQAGTVDIHAGAVQVSTGAQITSSSRFGLFGDTPTGNAGTITVQGLTSPAQSVLIDGVGSGVFTDTQGSGAGGNIFVNANSVMLQNGGAMSVDTSGAGHGGTIDVVATESLSLKDASSISSNSNSELENAGSAGVIRLNAPVIDVQTALVSASTVGPGNAGDIVLEANRVILGASESGRLHEQGADIFTRTTGPGLAGDITIRGGNGPESQAEIVTISGFSRMLSESFFGESDVQGNAGNISIQTNKLTLSEGSRLSTASESSTGNAGDITIEASDEVRISSHGQLSSGAIEFASGNGGSITVSAPTALVESGGLISTNTDYIGNAGEIQIKANTVQLKTGGQISSSSVINQGAPDIIPSGSAGIITIQGLASPAQSVIIDGSGSGLFTDTQGSGAGGNILVNANSVAMTNGATVSASSTGQVETPGDAGNIDITATNGFTMQNGAITTQAGQGASGGNIKVTTSPEATVLFQNSRISASVADGPGGGGNISIDPQFVILQNSQILAQAAQGQGGTITITANLFLPDANSIVNADSGSGVNGTVTIQSPNAPASGKIQPLGKTPLQATLLLNQHCASLAGGEFSSFTVAGRDSLPTEPGSWLASPLALATLSEGTGLAARGAGREGDIQILSLRQIAPIGFLTQAFALDWSAGCKS